MAYANEKINQFEKGLCTLEEVQRQEKTVIVRDATIQRFEYTTELCWKAMKTFLWEWSGVDASTPKDVFREAGVAHILTSEEVALALQMIDDRNKASHIYSEELIDSLYQRIQNYTSLMRTVHDRLTQPQDMTVPKIMEQQAVRNLADNETMEEEK